jgi:hypothetical protein
MTFTSIGKADGEGVVSLRSDAWNIADGFTKIKILRILIDLDLNENIAMFGRKDMEEQLPEEYVPYKRVEALNRIVFSLRQLIGNCKFSIEKEKSDRNIVNGFTERLKNVEKYMNGIADYITNDITKENELRINEDHFRKCFDILREIKDELNFLLNRAGLIFKASDSLDLDDIMREIEQGG